MRPYKLRNPESRTIEYIAKLLYKLGGYRQKTAVQSGLLSDSSNPCYNSVFTILSPISEERAGREKLIELRYFGNGQKSDQPKDILVFFYDDACSINYAVMEQLQKYFDGDDPVRQQKNKDFWRGV